MQDLTVTEYKDVRVLTTQQLAEVYETSTDTITKNFNRNKDRYIEGKHYIALESAEKNDFVDRGQFDRGLKNAKTLYLWTEKGAFLHAKSLNTDIAWEVYERLVDSYFKRRDLLEGISPELRAVLVVDKRVSAVEQKVDYLENTMNIDHAQKKEIKGLANEVVVSSLGGKDAPAYRYKDSDGKMISRCAFSQFWNDFKDYFGINSYENLPRVKMDEAKQYINRWQPPTNMQLEIGRINRGGMVK